MTLQKLVGVTLERIEPSRDTVQRLITAAARHIADAKVRAVSRETRFVSAYTAIRLIADVGLHAHGYRALTSRPGHHQVAIQALVLTMGVGNATIVRLDFMRKQRNVTEYSGDIVPESAFVECLSQAELLYDHARRWLKAEKPSLL